MRALVLLAVVAALAFAPAPLPKRVHGPKEPNVHGDWEVVSWSCKPSPNSSTIFAVDAVRLVPRRMELFFREESQGRLSLTYDPSASPPRVDLCISESGQRMPGIYKAEGDTLTICYAEAGERRPTEFQNTKQWLVVLKRK